MSHRRAFPRRRTFRTGVSLLCLALCLTARTGRADVPPPTKTYTLRECLQAALTDPDTVTRWRIAQDKAASNVSLAKAMLYPQLTSIARATTSSSSDILNFSSADQSVFTREKSRFGLALSYPLYDAGKRIDQLRAARAGLRGTQSSIFGDKILLLNNTASAFYTVLHAQRFAEAGDLLLKAAQEHLRGAQERFNLGAVTKGDVLTAQSAVATATAEQEHRNVELVAARAHLAALMGGDPTKLIPAVTEPEAAQGISESTEQLIARALAYNPGRAQILAQKEAARHQLSSIRADRSPKLLVTGGVGYVIREDPNHPGHDQNSPYLILGIEINLPLLEGPSLRAQEKNQIAELELQDVTLHQMEDDIRGQILVANTAYQSNAVKVKAAQDALAAAEEAYRLAAERYGVGKGAQSEVLDALTRLTAARDGLADALNDRDIAAQNLRWITGMDRPDLTK